MSSHLYRAFNRLAKRIIHGPDEAARQAVTPNRSSFIQTEALPPYMDRLYRSFGGTGGRKFNPEYLHFTGRSDMGAMKSKSNYLRTLDRLHPHYAKDAMMEAGPLHTNTHLSNLPERDRKAAEISLAQMLYFQGMTKEVYEYFSSYINACQPDTEFVRYEEDQIRKISEIFLADPENIALVSRMRYKKFFARENVAAQYYLRLNFMQRLADKIAEAHNHPSVPVVLDELPPIIARANGVAFHPHSVWGMPKTGIILIDAKSETINSVKQMVNLIGHEMRHILDHTLNDRLQSGDLGVRNVNFIHAGMIALNVPAYVSTSLSREPGADKQALTDQFNRYASQYMERAARNFGEKLENTLVPGLPEIFDPSIYAKDIHLYSMH